MKSKPKPVKKKVGKPTKKSPAVRKPRSSGRSTQNANSLIYETENGSFQPTFASPYPSMLDDSIYPSPAFLPPPSLSPAPSFNVETGESEGQMLATNSPSLNPEQVPSGLPQGSSVPSLQKIPSDMPVLRVTSPANDAHGTVEELSANPSARAISHPTSMTTTTLAPSSKFNSPSKNTNDESGWYETRQPMSIQDSSSITTLLPTTWPSKSPSVLPGGMEPSSSNAILHEEPTAQATAQATATAQPSAQPTTKSISDQPTEITEGT